MTGKKVIFLIQNNSRKYLLVIPAVLIVTILICSAIFAKTLNNPLAGKHIIIDPGHGGIDPGTNDSSGFMEKDINLQISLKLKEIMEAKDAVVDLTRNSDIALDDRNKSSTSRHKRDLLARVDNFNSGKYDLFISIHVNRSSNTRAIGPIVLYSTNFPSSALLASGIQENMNVHMKDTYEISIDRRPVKSDFFILQYASIPGVLVETGFISNPSDKRFLKDASYQEKLAKSICNGIADYFITLKEFSQNNPKDNDPLPVPPAEEDGIPANTINDIQLVTK